MALLDRILKSDFCEIFGKSGDFKYFEINLCVRRNTHLVNFITTCNVSIKMIIKTTKSFLLLFYGSIFKKNEPETNRQIVHGSRW